MGQQMCCEAENSKQFQVKTKSRQNLSNLAPGEQKYVRGAVPLEKNSYVEQKKKILQPYVLKSKIQRGKKYQPHLVTNSGVVYDGQWLKGQPHGLGELFFNDGSYYIGSFYQGFVHGQGRFISSSKLYYQGQIRHNVAQGKGICINDGQGYTYNGQWMNDLPNGKGTEQWNDGTKFQGDFINGSKNGYGKLIFGVDGSQYIGYFKQNQFQGQGKLTLPDGTYTGIFKKGKMEGRGKFVFNDGSIYDGEYKNNQKHGSGKYSKDGKVYQGLWQNGLRQGQGVLTNEQGLVAKGFWDRGQGYYL